MSGPFTGSVASILAGEKVNGTDLANWHDILQAQTDPWTAFTATWSATTTAPVLNDGTITAKYVRAGKYVDYAGKIIMGSATTFGTGVWTISLPALAADVIPIGSSFAFHTAAVGSSRSGIAQFRGTTVLQFWADGAAQFGPTIPFTWAVGDSLQWSITYEAA